MLAFDMAQECGGTFLLRIEDIDQSRARPEWEAQIYDDLRWLGLTWPDPVMRQSERQTTYANALNTLWDQGLIYPCTCSRKDILAATNAPQEGAPMGPDGIIYPGTCRHRPKPQTRPDTAMRFDISYAPEKLTFVETSVGHKIHTFPKETLVSGIGDFVVARNDMGTSYHLAVALDDAAQGVTHVVRGADLMDATPIHVLLQQVLGLPTPTYHHHTLVRDDTGKRLAKRDDARAIGKYRADGATPNDIRRLVGLPQV